MIEDERDICVVKCPFSLKTDRTRRSVAAHLTTQMSQEQLKQRFGGGITKALLSVWQTIEGKSAESKIMGFRTKQQQRLAIRINSWCQK
ncbi:MAG: hypothetical protein CFE27_15680 [Alphaproteobacteria bacterium PA1]|nr:MAG: hypothetical protein CFE27_15680 [Alphaproteobacteria bacterium PA1]